MFPERLPISDKQYFLNAPSSLGPWVKTATREYGQKYDVLLPQTGLPETIAPSMVMPIGAIR